MDKTDQSTTKNIRVLLVEDSEDDALLLILKLKQAGYDPIYERVDTAGKMQDALERSVWDIVISDYVLPGFSGLQTLQIMRDRRQDIPCIIVSGKITDETAVSAMRSGARDFISKDNLSRLGPVVDRELNEATIRKKRHLAEVKLQETNELNSILLANSPIPMLSINPDSSIRYVNQAAEKITGFSSGELIGSKAPYPFWPEDRYQDYLKDMEKDSFNRVEVIQKAFCNKHGEEFWVEMTLIPITIAGNMEYILSTWINLTEEMKLRKELEVFNHKIIRAQEEERKRIVRELHEDTVQILAIIKMELEALSRSSDIRSGDTRDKLTRLQDNTNHAMQDIRRFSYALRPGELDYLGLDATLEHLVEENSEQTGLPIGFQVKGESRRLSNDIELVLFRIAQEALNNIQKHSQATRATIKMDYLPDRTYLIIEDNGKGFNMENESDHGLNHVRLGLVGMRERAKLIGADLVIRSAPGKGTIITVEVKA